jgi:carboxymethylenebutenolidase
MRRSRGHRPGSRLEYVTIDIAKFMRRLEAIWDEHLDASLMCRDVNRSMANLTAEPSVRHIPSMTGAVGRPALERFYRTEFFPHVPRDLIRTKISRTVDRFRLVDEAMTSFTHDQDLPWLLPGVDPTYRRAEVLTIAVVSFERGLLCSQRILWDYASLTAQLGLPSLLGSSQLVTGVA